MIKTNATVPSNRAGCLARLGRGLFFLLALLAFLAPIGSLYQEIASRRDRARFPAPGRMIDMGGYRLHIYCIGQGSPTVVMEAGLGDGAFSWALVQPQTAQFTRACAYDRPGLGWSDFIDQAFLSAEAARNLHTLLARAGEPGPYLLVGHSAGGIYLRSFAHLYPAEVSGLVLVESAHESQVLRYEQRLQMGVSPLRGLLRACQVIAPTGFLRLTGVTGLTLSDSTLPIPIKQSAVAGMNRTTYCRTIENELRSTDIDMSQPGGLASLGRLPLIVLTAGRRLDNRGPGGAMGDTIWQQLQRELTSLSSHGRQVVAAQSDHYIQWSQPELVVQAIRDLIDR